MVERKSLHGRIHRARFIDLGECHCALADVCQWLTDSTFLLSPVLVDTLLSGDRVIRLSSTNGPEFELLTDAVS
jgi:hypothetical protein